MWNLHFSFYAEVVYHLLLIVCLWQAKAFAVAGGGVSSQFLTLGMRIETYWNFLVVCSFFHNVSLVFNKSTLIVILFYELILTFGSL